MSPGNEKARLNLKACHARLKLSGHKPDTFLYDLDELARLFGVRKNIVRRWISQGILNPYSLASICALWAKYTRLCA